MICPNCKNEVTGKYCSYCGTLLQPETDGEERRDGQASPDRKDPAADQNSQKMPGGGNPPSGRKIPERAYTENGQIDPENFPWEEMNLGQNTQQIQASVVLSEALRGKNMRTAAGGDNLSAGDSMESTDDGQSREDLGDSRMAGRRSGQTFSGGGSSSGASSGKVKVKQTTKKKTKVKKKGKNPVLSAISSAGSAAKGGTRAVWKTVIMLLQGICFVLMAYLTIRFARSFWAQRSALGAVQDILSQRNLAEALYMIAGGCTAAYGALQALWMLSRRKIADRGRILRYDAGRGMMGFAAFLILGLAARYVGDLLPSAPWLFLGIKQYLLVAQAMEGTLIRLGILGILLCVVRKVGAR